MEERIYGAYVQLLKRELVPAIGCTELIAVAYAAAVVLSVRVWKIPSAMSAGWPARVCAKPMQKL